MRFAILFILLHLASICAAQNLRLKITGADGLKIDYNEIVGSYEEAHAEANEILIQLYEASYLAATVDSIKRNEETIIIEIDKGKQYKWINLSKGNLEADVEAKIDISNRLFLNRPFSTKQLTALFKRTIEYFENSGYPFAAVKLDSFQLDENNNISAALNVTKNQFYKIDSILLKGNSGINRRYLLSHLELDEGIPFNEEKIANISTRIQEIPFIAESRKHEVQYFEDGVKILLYTERKKASRFDGILGLLTNENDGSIELTGDVDLNLINSFNRGESIGLNWRKLKGNSQDLNLKLLYPYFFNTPFGVDFDFKLFKRDTTFLDLTTRAGFNYTFKKGELITLFLENKSSNLLSRNSIVATNTGQLPSLGDVSINSFGLNYSLRRYDYLYNPTKGFSFSSTFAVGRKRLKKIRDLELENPLIYRGVDLNTIQYQGQLQATFFIPIKNRSTFMIGNQSATILVENQQIYQNELLRIGGLKLLRGFDEESINASTYSIFTFEYRFLLDRNSYFSLFMDRGYYENQNVDETGNVFDRPYGIGAGVSFETAAGIFTFNYAVGKQFDNPIEFQAAKVHFGFVNFF